MLPDPAGIYMFKVDKRNTRTRCEICSNLTIKIPERRHWRAPIVSLEQVNAGWEEVLSFLKTFNL